MAEITEAQAILIINLGGIGDILLSLPALTAIRKKYSRARISLVVVPRAYAVAKSLSFIDDIFLLDIKLGPASIWNNLKVIFTLRQRAFDLAINMRTLVSAISALKMRLLFSLIHPKVSAGRDTEGRGNFFDLKITETTLGNKSELDYDLDMAVALGAEVLDRTIKLEVEIGALNKLNSLLEVNSIASGDILVNIHIGGKPSHRWPKENFFQLICALHKQLSCKFIVTGDDADFFTVEDFMKRSEADIVNLVAKLSFQELAALIKRCDICISNDTGSMHIAAAVGTPIVAIFGPGYLTRFDPRNISPQARVLYKKTDCAPCDKVICNSLKCLKSISPEEVVEAALSLLKENKGKI